MKRTTEEANKERLALLSKKFTTGLTPFEAARLAIASREVEEGWPAFTAADFARLGRITKAAIISRIRLRRLGNESTDALGGTDTTTPNPQNRA